ncbi:MurT ligase domain-containing protein [Sporolactobacillus sp. CQH2019]|uniref:Mur ligase family protein n=1 Tax=Sporolactobacillus sp. CQH2019 TaxID=3023512 RepID=UPI002367AE18|nr:Mur ligase family protein [Sporolactobacillus sp. CQH2019]MDD9149205.1 MurT ligase domain-containing protein [Sporolactobacillus sp. CQH2019]
MPAINTYMAILTNRGVKKFIQLMHQGHGNTLSGELARMIDPRILKKLSSTMNVIAVTGTNGKTTTCNLISNIFKSGHIPSVHNSLGNNLMSGITTAFIDDAGLNGKMKDKWAIVEVDEATMVPLLKEITPKIIVINNFFRDQLDRYGEIDLLIEKIYKAIEKVDAKLVLNADDPFVNRFSDLKNEKIYFGIGADAIHFEKNSMADSKYCPNCGRPLHYSQTFYGQLGYYSCECGFKRHDPKFEVENVRKAEHGYQLTINQSDYILGLSGVHNIYNALAAFSVAQEIRIPIEAVREGLETYSVRNGRMTTYLFNHTRQVLNLVKNPAGYNITISEVNDDPQKKQIVLFLNDFAADGEDISWIWDVDFEKFRNEKVWQIICSGTRAYDLAIRLKYAEIGEEKVRIIPNLKKAIDQALESASLTYYLPNYTPLEHVRSYLELRTQSDQSLSVPEKRMVRNQT